MGKQFEAEAQTLFDTYAGQNAVGYVIPEYQRAYTWETDQIDSFVAIPLLKIQQLGDLNSEEFDTLAGSIIYLSNKSTGPIISQARFVIDGQQRLTTVVLLTALLYLRITKLTNRVEGDQGLNESLLEAAGLTITRLRQVFSYNVEKPSGDSMRVPRILRHSDRWPDLAGRHALYDSLLSQLIATVIAGEDPDPGALTHEEGERALTAAVGHVAKFVEVLSSQNERFQVVEPELPDIPIDWSQIMKFSGVSDFDEFDLDSTARGLLLSVAYAQLLLDHIYFANVVASTEESAFQVFESLNTSGQPLTAIETFRPRLLKLEQDLEEPERIRVHGNFSDIEAYFNQWDKHEQKEKQIGEVLVPFHRLVKRGQPLSQKIISEHRNFLRKGLDPNLEVAKQIDFLDRFRQVVNFFQYYWERNWAASSLVLGHASHNPLTPVVFDLLRQTKHDIMIPIVLAAARAHDFDDSKVADAQAANEFESIVLAIGAFSILWRIHRDGGASNIDSAYKKVMQKLFTDSPPAITLSEVKRELSAEFRNRFGTKDQWVQSAADQAKYFISPEGQRVTGSKSLYVKFLLTVACHDTVVDDNDCLLRKRAAPGSLNLLNITEWNKIKDWTFEHLAPVKPAKAEHLVDEDEEQAVGYGKDVYTNTNYINLIGNFVLIPLPANRDVLGNKGWDAKRLILQYLSECDLSKRQEISDRLTAIGEDVERYSEILVQHQCLQMIGAIHKTRIWSYGAIQKRSRNMMALAYEALSGYFL